MTEEFYKLYPYFKSDMICKIQERIPPSAPEKAHIVYQDNVCFFRLLGALMAKPQALLFVLRRCKKQRNGADRRFEFILR